MVQKSLRVKFTFDLWHFLIRVTSRPRCFKSENYRIEVEGHLAESRSDILAGMCNTNRKRADQKSVAILTGRLRDQAELLGVLNGLYNLHLSILKVEVANSVKPFANLKCSIEMPVSQRIHLSRHSDQRKKRMVNLHALTHPSYTLTSWKNRRKQKTSKIERRTICSAAAESGTQFSVFYPSGRKRSFLIF